MSFELGDHEAH